MKLTKTQWLAWFYCANFLFIVALSHWPGLTNAKGELLGLFVIDPVDDIFHLRRDCSPQSARGNPTAGR
jgi:hypothetical protein